MLVSIIVPFYNVEPYFRRCLDSIVNQSYRDVEIILVNDYSPDNSISIAREYAQKDSRIIIIEHEKNLGLGGARNSGLAAATGEYVWFIDSDDAIATPYAVEHLVAVAKRDQSDIIFFRAERKTLDNQKLWLDGDYIYDTEHIFNNQQSFYDVYLNAILDNQNLYTAILPMACFKFFKTSFLKKYHFTFLEHTLHEDVPLLILLPLAERVTQLPYIFYIYYQRHGSIMHTKMPDNYIEHFERIVQQLWNIYDQYWGDWINKRAVVTIIIIGQITYTINKFKVFLSRAEYQGWLVQWYDFLKEQLSNRVSDADMNPWPQAVTYPQAWSTLFKSFDRTVSQREKYKIMSHLLVKRSCLQRLKHMIKMLLPYGVVRLIQKLRSR